MNNEFIGTLYVPGRASREGIVRRANGYFRSACGRFRRSAVLAGALALAAPLGVLAQGNAVRPRITAQINESNLTTLRGNTHPMARPQFDRGAVADSQPMRRMLLLLQRSPEQETGLKALIDQQQSKSSPNYHQWLTPQQFGQQFGAAPADIQAVSGWLQSHGFQVARVSTSGTLIEFSGTAGQVLNAFHTEIHRYAVNGQEHFANSSDPQIPAALAPVVAGTVSLHDFARKAQSRKVGVFQKDLTTGKVVPQFSFACSDASGANATCNALGPGDFAKIYNVQSLWDAGIDGTGQTIAIVGDSEICTATSPDFSTTCGNNDDVATFRTIFGLPAKSPNVILDGPDPGFNSDEIEGNLDVQWSGAVAKNATIDFVTAESTEASAGVDLSAEYIVDNNLAPVMSESFGTCEANLGTTGNEFYSGLWEQAAAQGITVIVSAGDNASAGCDDQNTQTAAGQNGVNFGAGVSGIASTPFNVSTGGTDFEITATNYQSTYWGGADTTNTEGIKHISALSYIPETTWNDSCAQNFTGAVTGCSPPPSLLSLNIVGGSGGQSNCVTDACNVGYSKPAWQAVATGSGLTAGTDLSRDLPDVSLFASDGLVTNSFYAICDANFSNGPCDATPGFVDVIGVGGTSSSAPTFAGIMALVNQQMTTLNGTNSKIPTRQGNANYVLYHLFAGQSGNCSSSASGGPASGCTFNDVIKGNISVPCVGTSFGCSNTNNAGSFGVLETTNSSGVPTGTLAFNAGTGYDLATGLGSVNAANLVNNWGAAVGAYKATTTTLCLWTTNSATCPSPAPTSISIAHGATVHVAIGVSPNPFTSSSIPEDAALIGTFTGNTPGCNVTGCNTSGVDHFNFPLGNVDVYPLGSNGTVGSTTTFLVGGSYSVVAHYAGDGTNGASFSTTPIPVTVTAEPSTTTVSTGIFNFFNQALAPSTSAFYGDSIILRADVVGNTSGQESATGAVTLKDGVNSIGAFTLNAEGYAEDQTASNVTGAFTAPLSIGTHSFTATFPGDPSYGASSASTPVAFSVVPAPTTTVVTPSVTTVAANTAFSLTAFVDTQSNSVLSSGGSSGAAPTGMVTFKAGATTLATVPVTAAPLDGNGFVTAQATLSNVTLTSTASITATYNGDGNYTASPASPAVTVTVSNGATFSLTPSNGGIMSVSAPGGQPPASDTITVTGSNGFSGTVTLTVASVSPSNLSDPPSCSFGSTGTVTLNSGAVPPVNSGSGTITCNTTAKSHVFVMPSNRPQAPNGFLALEACAAIACIFLLGMTGKKRRGSVLLGMSLLVVVLVGTSCGGSSGGGGGGTGGGNPGTTVDTYTVTVTATPSTGTPQQMTLTLNVN